MTSEKRRVAVTVLLSAAALVPMILYQVYVSEPIGVDLHPENMTHAEKARLEENMRETVMTAVCIATALVVALTAFSWWFERRKERDGL